MLGRRREGRREASREKRPKSAGTGGPQTWCLMFAEPWKNARLLTRDAWSLPSLTEGDSLQEGAPRCSLSGWGAGLGPGMAWRLIQLCRPAPKKNWRLGRGEWAARQPLLQAAWHGAGHTSNPNAQLPDGQGRGERRAPSAC